MKYVTAYLNFDGNCRQAMQFCKKCLATVIQIRPYPDAKGQPTDDPKARIMHSQLLRNGKPLLMASDMPPVVLSVSATTSPCPLIVNLSKRSNVCSPQWERTGK